MTPELTRRSALLSLGGASLLASFSAQAQSTLNGVPLVVIGGGFGGATAARYLKGLLPSANVTLVEANPTYTACPFSNLVISGDRDIASQEFDYRSLEALGITMRHQRAIDVDPGGKSVTLADGTELPYERLILSPGVDLRWGAIEGYDEAAAQLMPHAWNAGEQTLLLRQKLDAMDDGGTVVISAPAAPYRCPPGPYERASLIAHYLKTQKPRSKLIVLDAKDRFSKMPLFLEAWAAEYPDHLEWRSAFDDGRVSRIDAEAGTLETDFESFAPAVANIIPPQKAGAIADRAGVTDATGWCPINGLDFSSTLQPGIHVIGDASIANPMPKSAFSANLQGKLCALQISASLAGGALEPIVLANTCYSYTTPATAVSIVGVYSNADGNLSSVEGAGGLSPSNAPIGVRQSEAVQAADWFRAITRETFG